MYLSKSGFLRVYTYSAVFHPLPVPERHKHWEVDYVSDQVPELQLPYLCWHSSSPVWPGLPCSGCSAFLVPSYCSWWCHWCTRWWAGCSRSEGWQQQRAQMMWECWTWFPWCLVWQLLRTAQIQTFRLGGTVAIPGRQNKKGKVQLHISVSHTCWCMAALKHYEHGSCSLYQLRPIICWWHWALPPQRSSEFSCWTQQANPTCERADNLPSSLLNTGLHKSHWHVISRKVALSQVKSTCSSHWLQWKLKGFGTCSKLGQCIPRLEGNMDITWEGSEVASQKSWLITVSHQHTWMRKQQTGLAT